MEEPLLDVSSLSIGLKTERGYAKVVDSVDFDIAPNETVALLGESGCGKSLTALSLLQLLPVQAKFYVDTTVEFHAQDISQFSAAMMRRIRGRKIGFIFQEPMTSLNPVKTIGEQLAEVLRLHTSLSRQSLQARLVSLLNDVNMPDPQKQLMSYPHQLSGGMKQRAMIAMALAGEPELLIADEPTTALDVTIQAQIIQLLKSLQQQRQMAILLITHDLGVVKQMADRICVMYAGQIIEQATANAFFEKPLHPYSERLFAALPSLEKRSQQLSAITGQVPHFSESMSPCRFAPRCPYAQNTCFQVVPLKHIVKSEHMASCHRYDLRFADQFETHVFVDDLKKALPSRKSDSPILSVRDLKVHFPIQKGLLKRTVAHLKAVDGIDLDLYPGRTVALVGESGSGKTTFGKAIVELIDANSGSIRYGNQTLKQLTQHDLKQLKRDVQFIFQDPFSAMNPRMLVQDIIAEALALHGGYSNRAAREERIAQLLEMVGLPSDARLRYPHEFSGGQRQRICIARALAVEPKVLILDEPTSALDISIQAQILNLLKALQTEFGYAYCFITHNLSVVAYLADEVSVMYLGRVVEQGPVEMVLRYPKHPYTQALVSAIPDIGRKNVFDAQIKGELPSAIEPPSGCPYHPRCPYAFEPCPKRYPRKTDLGSGHWAHCYLLN